MKKIMGRAYLDSLYMILDHRLEGWLNIGDEGGRGCKKKIMKGKGRLAVVICCACKSVTQVYLCIILKDNTIRCGNQYSFFVRCKKNNRAKLADELERRLSVYSFVVLEWRE